MVKHRIKDSAIAGSNPAPTLRGVCVLNESWPMKATGLWAMYNSTGNQIDTDSKRYHIWPLWVALGSYPRGSEGSNPSYVKECI